MKPRIGYYFLLDLLVVMLAFLVSVWIRPHASARYLTDYTSSFFLFLLIWGLISWLFNKYKFCYQESLQKILSVIVFSNVFSFALVTSIMYILRIWHFSRFVVMGTVGIATVIEITYCSLFFWIKTAQIRPDNIGINLFKNGNQNGNGKEIGVRSNRKNIKSLPADKEIIDASIRKATILEEISEEAYDYIFHYAAIDSPNTLFINTTSRFNIDMQMVSQFEAVVNLKRVNDIRRINKFFESVNSKLPVGGLFIDYAETKDLRKKRILRKFPVPFNYLFYTFDFIIKRVFPKFILTKKIYFILTRGQNRVLTKAETLGRLYSCGFEVLEEKQIKNYLFFIAIKTKNPAFPENPTYGPLVALQRIGKHGKPIKVYKMRTMHPYSEYLQDYIYQRAGLQYGGKFKNDFRVTTIGKIMRKLWLDELPMLLNVLKGELKIVGVRPLSKHYFNLYTKELQQLRIQFKPGLIPPFYVDKPGSLEDIMISEMKYLNAYRKHPVRTDIKYFFIALFNIIFRHYRSN